MNRIRDGGQKGPLLWIQAINATGAAENAIRSFVLGRKNWLFANSQAGARSSAAIYSVIQTSKANGFEPFGYLKHVSAALSTAHLPRRLHTTVYRQ